MNLFLPNKLKKKVKEWARSDYECDFSAISEILNFSVIETNTGERSLRFLRKAQFNALETYWYLRLVEETPHVLKLYRRFFENSSELLKSLNIPLNEEVMDLAIAGNGIDSVFEKIKQDVSFVKKYKLQALRESLTLNYPSYILALAMGTGKTVLIGSIIATEIAMALEYPDSKFVRNALVFAPGKTILGALREISDIPYEKNNTRTII